MVTSGSSGIATAIIRQRARSLQPLQRLAYRSVFRRRNLLRLQIRLLRVGLLSLFFVEHAEVVPGAAGVGLVRFWFVGQVFAERLFAFREVLADVAAVWPMRNQSGM